MGTYPDDGRHVIAGAIGVDSGKQTDSRPWRGLRHLIHRRGLFEKEAPEVRTSVLSLPDRHDVSDPPNTMGILSRLPVLPWVLWRVGCPSGR